MAFINNFSVRNRDLDGVPNTLVIMFSSGDEVSYVRKVDGIEEAKWQPLTHIELPEYDFGKFNPSNYDLRANYAMCNKTLITMMKKLKSSLEEAGVLRDKAKSEIDEKYDNWAKNLRSNYSTQKKKWQNLKRELESSEGRERMVVKWLEKSGLETAPSVIKMLESATEMVAKRLRSTDLKFHTFISHVQKCSADLCGRLSDAMSHIGLTPWYDMNASKLDMQGIVEGVIDSKIFTVVLTKDYFTRKWCLFEYCIAIVADKPIVALHETDPRFEGGHLNELNIPEQFKQIMNHEIIKIDRRGWKSFLSAFEQAIKARQHSVSVFIDRVEGVKSSSNILIKNSDIKFLNEALQTRGWTFGGRIFSSTADGFTVKNFHDHCDDKGATLTVAKRKNGIIYGGFIPFSWETREGETVDAPEAWLFYVKDQSAPKLLDIGCGEVEAFVSGKHGPYITIDTSSESRMGFGIHGTTNYNHFIKGNFAGNLTTDLVIVEIEEYEVFQILKTVI